MAKGYIVGDLVVNDPQAFAHYVEAASAAMKQHGVKALARGGRCEVLEGHGASRQVIMEFESYEAARSYYYSREYQAAKTLRNGKAIATILLVEGV